MKWIGQHIWDFISRFRSDVYFEAVPDGIIDSGKSLGLDTDNKLVKAAGGTGNGVTIKDEDGNTFSDITEITHYGLDTNVKVYDNGTGKVIVDHHQRVTSAPKFSISTGGNFVDVFAEYNIATPVNQTSRMFHKGTASNPQPVTDSNSFTFSTSNQRSKMEPVGGNKPKIEVTIRGANSNISSGNNQILGSTIHEINSNGTTTDTATGITIQISSYVLDTVVDSDSRKAVVSVTWDPSILAGAHIATNANGSQFYESISIKHTDSSGVTISGSTVFTSSEPFFYDGSKTTPSYSGTPTLTIINTSATKLLSNILYYYNNGSSPSGVGWRGEHTGIANFSRDTYPISTTNHGTVKFDFPNNFQSDSTPSVAISGHGFTNNEDGTFLKTLYLTSDMIGVNKTLDFNVESVIGGFSSDAVANGSVTSSPANYLSRTSTNSLTAEYFYDEEYRIPEASVVTVNTSTATLENLEDNSMQTSGVSLATGKDHLVQTWGSMNNFKLRHPNDMPTVANLPVQVQWSGSAPSDGTYVEYYRYFSYSTYADSRVWDLGMTRAQYIDNYNDDLIEIWISRPGDNSYHDFIELKPADDDESPVSYNLNDNTNTCYSGSQPATASHFKAQFSGSSNLYIMCIRMKSGTTGAITKIVSI